MRMFLVWVGSDPHHISVEVLSYDRTTNMMRVRCKDGTEYDRIFLPKAKHNQRDFKLVTTEDDEDA